VLKEAQLYKSSKLEINMDFTTITKTFETQSKMFADVMQPHEFKDVQQKSKDFALTVLDAQTKAIVSGIEAFGKFAGKESTTYLLKVTELVDTTYTNAKEIIQTGTIKGFAHAGDKK
jgi:hypothetical protein